MPQDLLSKEHQLATVLADLDADCVAWLHEGVLEPNLIQRYTKAFRNNNIQRLHVCDLEGGELIKQWATLPDLFDRFVDWGLTRRSVVLTTGGGAFSDAVGMAASLWKRGMRVIHMPTTPLAAVDAAWGGKTAFNWRGAKNQVGTIHLPEHVHLDARWMRTLSPREFRAGLAEAVKHAMLDRRALNWMQTHDIHWAGNTDWDGLTLWFDQMSITKRGIVAGDLNEQGERNVLNLGHTVAHALEAAASDQGESLLHGEAVAVGLRFALFEATQCALSPDSLDTEGQTDSKWIDHWLEAHLPLPEMAWPTANALWRWMHHDKKNHHAEVKDMAWRGIGRVEWPLSWEKQIFEATWEQFLRLKFSEA